MNLDHALAGIEPHIWTSEPDVASFLACLVRMHAYESVVEVGVFRGFTSCHLIASLGVHGRYVGVDLEDHRADTARAYMAAMGQTFLLGDSRVVLSRLPAASADLIFLDGNHTLPYVRAEFLESLRILRPGGLVCIHDYHSRGVRIWVDYVRSWRAFDALVLGTSQGRGLAVVAPLNGRASAGLAFRLWFLATRNPFMIRIGEWIQAKAARARNRGSSS